MPTGGALRADTAPARRAINTEFDPVTHIARVDKVLWPSVAQLEREFKLIDFSMVPDERLIYKQQIGLRVHAASVLLDNGSLDEDHFDKTFPECVPYLDAYRKFRTIEDFAPIVKEVRLFSKKWRFHGAPDEAGTHLGLYQGHLCVVDYKCSYIMYPATGPQCCGYEMLIRENADELGIDKALFKKKVIRMGLLLKPTGNYDPIFFNDPRDMMEFQACVLLHWSRREKFKTMTEEDLLRIYAN